MTVCPGCGAENDDTVVFCASCGDIIDWGSSSGPVMADHRASAPSNPPAAPAEPAEPAGPVEPAEPVEPAVPVPAAPPSAEAPSPAPVPAPVPPPPAPAAQPPPPPTAPPPPSAPPPPPAFAPAPPPPVAAPPPPPAPAPPEDGSPPPAPAEPPERKPAAPRTTATPAARPAEPEPAEPQPDPAAAERMRRLVAKSALLPKNEPAAEPAAESPSAAAHAAPAGESTRVPSSTIVPPKPPVSIASPTRSVSIATPTSVVGGATTETSTAASRLVARSAPTAPGTPGTPSTPSRPSTPGAPTTPSTPADGKPGPSSLAAAIQIAERSGRTDLASRLRANRERIRRTGVTIAIVGEFKKGKSTLVNALVNAEVCPSDPVDATVVPIAVTHGEDLTATVEFKGRPSEKIELTQISEFGTEAGNEDNHLRVTRIEVELPRRLLASGLVVLDTPGVGGLESAAGALNLATLERADGVLFVTDCSQELTAPELAYLAAARQRCPQLICVMTKADLHLAAMTLCEHNRGHLAAAGLGDVPILMVSSVLHLLSLAESDAHLEHESGFAELFDVILRTIWEPTRTRELAEAGEQLADLADHLAMPLEAAQQAKGSAQAAEQTIARLSEAQDRVRQFRSNASRWQQRLNEGMQDASVDLDHDLRTRMRTLSRMVDGRVDADDPADDLVFEAWVHKMVIEEVVGHYEMISQRANGLAEEIDQYFATLDRESSFQVDAAVPTELLATVHVSRDQLVKDGIASRVIRTGQGYSSGLVLFSSVVGVVSALPWIPLLALPFAGFMAKRAFSDDRERRKSARGVELKRLATKYLDEIGFIVHKDSRDTVRRIQRDIREHYARRAEQLELTLQQAMASAERARAAPSPQAGAADIDADDQAVVRDIASVARRLTAGLAVAS
jgi:Dynamin family